MAIFRRNLPYVVRKKLAPPSKIAIGRIYAQKKDHVFVIAKKRQESAVLSTLFKKLAALVRKKSAHTRIPAHNVWKIAPKD